MFNLVNLSTLVLAVLLWFSHTTFTSLAQDVPPAAPPPLPATNLTVLPGFKTVEVRAAQPGEGSWVCLAIDDKGRLTISPEELAGKNAARKPATGGLLRLTLSSEGRVAKVETINLPVGAAMGLLYAFNNLYVNGQGPAGTGLYRLRDTDGDDQFDQAELLKRFEGTFRTEATGEHGSHGIVLGPDQMLYVINGNETKPPAGWLPGSPHKNYQEDQLLPPQLWPANYTWANGPPPGGCVLRTDPDGKEWTLICGGLRNAYDLAFNRDGEMFTFDSDMDWDDGSPWYRPTRINHLVSGGEYGWRKGTGKWPEYYPDSLRGTLDIGRSSPTGLKFGYDARFPRRYRYALYACDWAFGTIYAIHFTPSGASYKATAEKFITGKPLNVTDMEFGRDGAMYFITGGRGTQSALYRVTYEEPIAKQAPVWGQAEQVGLKSRQLRHKLESYHGRPDASAIDFAWPHLDSGDRWIRYAARIAIEWQDVKLWQRRALDEPRPVASINALLALARCGDRSIQRQLLESLERLNEEELSEEHKLDALRVLELTLIRMGRPDGDTATWIIERLDAFYPAASDVLNRELCQLLVYLDAPGVISKTLAMLAKAKTQEQQMAYAFALRNVKRGWTPDQRTAYFQWFPRAAAHYTGSNYFLDFLADTKRDAMSTLTADERKALAACLEEKGKTVAATPAIPTRAFVKDWKWEDLLPVLDQVSHGRSYPKGREAFTAGQCVLCHRFGDEGGAIGPDLTAVGSRFNRHDLLEAILRPSKVVPDQFQNTMIATKDGEAHTGRVMFEDADKVVLSPNPLTPDRVEIPKRNIQSRQVSKFSPMPEGLVNVLTMEEILDLLAYLEGGGNTGNPRAGK